jgi:hypothetical protein
LSAKEEKKEGRPTYSVAGETLDLSRYLTEVTMLMTMKITMSSLERYENRLKDLFNKKSWVYKNNEELFLAPRSSSPTGRDRDINKSSEKTSLSSKFSAHKGLRDREEEAIHIACLQRRKKGFEQDDR